MTIKTPKIRAISVCLLFDINRLHFGEILETLNYKMKFNTNRPDEAKTTYKWPHIGLTILTKYY